MRTERETLLRRALGAASVLFGVWVWMAVALLLKRVFDSDGELVDYSLLWVIPGSALPAVFPVYFGIKLYREMSAFALKGIFALPAVLLTLWISATSQQLLPQLLPERVWGKLMLFLSTTITVAMYVLAVRKLIPRLGGPNRPATTFIGRGILLIFAFELHHLLSGLFELYRPVKEGDIQIHIEALRGLVPLAVAVGFYKMARMWFGRERRAVDAEQVVN